MATPDDTPKSPADNRIVARTEDAAEVEITVADRLGLVCILTSDGRHLILAPQDATMLCLDLIEVLFKRRQASAAGPLKQHVLGGKNNGNRGAPSGHLG